MTCFTAYFARSAESLIKIELFAERNLFRRLGIVLRDWYRRQTQRRRSAGPFLRDQPCNAENSNRKHYDE